MKASKFGEVLYTHLCTTLLVGSFYPLAGVLADTFWGRYNVIKIGLWLIAFALGFICINLSIIDGVTESVGRIFLPITCILLIAIGSACMRWSQCYFLWGWPVATRLHIRPDKLLLFLVWFHSKCQYIVGSRCISFTTKRFSTILFPSSRRGPLYYYTSLQELMKSIDIHYKTLIVILIAVGAIVCSLLLHTFKHYWYFKNSQRENPVKTIVNVSWYSLTVRRQLPIYRRTFHYGEAKQPRIELAKRDFDGIFEAEEVENVKSFYQILFLILSLGGFLASNRGVSRLEYCNG